MISNIQLIAEVKTVSPFGFKSKESWDSLFELANKYGDILSIHTDQRWGGSFDLIKKARKLTGKPILAKGIHSNDEDITKALENGADIVLVVGRIPKVHLDKCLIEPLTLEELKNIPEGSKVVWNSRDLSSGGFKEETFEQAKEIWKGWICQASNIKSIKDVKEGANAILIGSNLRGFIESIS